MQYTRGLEDEAYFLNEASPVRVGTDMTHLMAAENTLPVSIDYTRPMRAGRLELGTKCSDGGYGELPGGPWSASVIYQGLGDYSDWDEDIYADTPTSSRQALVLIGGRPASRAHNGVVHVPDDNIYYGGSDAYNYFEAFQTPSGRIG